MQKKIINCNLGSTFIILIALIASAFFSGLEIAFITCNKLRVELESKQGNWLAGIISNFNKFPTRFLGTMLLGNTLALVVFGIYMEEKLRPHLIEHIHSSLGLLLVQTFLSTVLILIAAEFLPKNVFRINPNRTLNFFALPLWLIYWALYPVVYVIIRFSENILKSVFHVNVEHGRIPFGRVDLDNYVREGIKTGKRQEVDHEIKIFKNALDFANVKVRECMVPRTEIMAIDVTDSMENLKAIFVQTRLSKILVFTASVDNIIGYVHSHELFKRPETIREILLPVNIVPESMLASEMLTLFIQQRKSIAVVVDEFGGTSGMLTMEDVMEEIFGEIEDEHDREELMEKRINDREYLFSGRLEIDYINEKYKLNLPSSEDFETLSGLIVHYHESIPHLNEEIIIPGFFFKITAVGNNRIEQVALKISD
jgi:putative hemolysin